jgi:hypothetical protein
LVLKFVEQLKAQNVMPTFKKCGLLAVVMLQIFFSAEAQTTSSSKEVKRWYETISLRGYMQVRYNRLFETNPKLRCEQCDRSWGENGTFFIRRGRLILSGNIKDNIFFYIQPDFGSSTGTTLNLFQLRDAYFDIGFDKKNEFRVRIGQSKIPFGFENMQSSQNRLPLDRADALNSAVSNERDLGAFFYWAPENARKLYAGFVNNNEKGSGDYGVFGIGIYSGQTANRPELNNNVHIASRLSIPIKIGNQYIEPGIQGYIGKYVVPTENRTANVKSVKSFEFNDKRVAGSFILYPRPLGIQAEYNVGQGPRFNPGRDSIETTSLSGGYATISYKILGKRKEEVFFPFTRLQAYNGGKKHELDARTYHVREIETGIEWQYNKNFELTVSYVLSHRRFEDSRLKVNDQKGRLLRVQAQLNF